MPGSIELPVALAVQYQPPHLGLRAGATADILRFFLSFIFLISLFFLAFVPQNYALVASLSLFALHPPSSPQVNSNGHDSNDGHDACREGLAFTSEAGQASIPRQARVRLRGGGLNQPYFAKDRIKFPMSCRKCSSVQQLSQEDGMEGNMRKRGTV